jgi:Gpi18-like mannosyltransferase
MRRQQSLRRPERVVESAAPAAKLVDANVHGTSAMLRHGIPWDGVIIVVLGLRILLSIVGAGVRLLLPQPHQSLSAVNLFLGPWRYFDAEHFIEIAAHGYQGNSLNTAYLPLYPLAIKIVSIITAGHYLTAALLVSNLACVAGVGLFWRWVADRYTEQTAWRAVAILLLFPDSFYLLGAYSESLFLLFSAGSFLALQRERPMLASVLAVLAVLTRLQGLVLLVPLAFDLWHRRRSPAQLGAGIAYLTLPPAALAVYQKILTSSTHAVGLVDTFQHKWNITLQAPWQTIWQYVTLIRSPQWHLIDSPKANYVMLWDLVIALIVLAVLIVSWRRLGIELFVYGLASWCFALSRWYSTGRYMLAILPFFVAVAIWTDKKRLRPITTTSMLLLVFLAAQFAQGSWVD